MNIYFDTEFTGLHKNTSLISIGLIDDSGRKFYAEVVDYDRSQVNDWIKDNVVNNLWSVNKTINEFDDVDYFHIGTKKQIADDLKEWLSHYSNVQLVSDVCHYDMVLFIDLFGGAFDLPSNVNPVCYDINTDIAKFLDISHREAFDINREELLGIKCNAKHNALWDAEVIQKIYWMVGNHEAL